MGQGTVDPHLSFVTKAQSAMRFLDPLVLAALMIAATLWLAATLCSPIETQSQAARPYVGPDVALGNG